MKLHPSLTQSLRRQQARRVRRQTRGVLGLLAWADTALPSSLHRARADRQPTRRGSTLLVVMALLGMLTLLGMLYFTFASQEQANATNFAEAAKQISDPGDDIEAIFDHALRQLIQGPNYEEKNSALWGGRHSLAFNMLGHDLQPFNGAGVRVHRSTSDQLIVDQNRDGAADADQSLLELNDSPAARSAWPPVERRVETLPAPDVDYTYPDHNNAFLAYIGTTWKTPSGAAATGYPVIKPSFHRPEFLRDNSGVPITDWETHTGSGGAPFPTTGRLFRPHPNHVYVPRQGQNITTAIRRFLNSYDPADAADILTLGTAGPTAPARGFPFTIEPSAGSVPLPGPLTRRQQGVWSLTALPPNPPFTFPAHDFDVDNDNDTIPDSIWMDLDLPILARPSDNKTYIPLVAFLIQDLDSLLNLNAVGNLSGDTRTTATTNFGNNLDIHRSAQGLSSPSEINPLWALDTRPSEAASVSDHTSYFHAPANAQHLANMEWWWLNKGRVEYSTPRQIHAGRYGEANRVWDVLNTAGAGPAIGVQMTNSNLFPFPGIWDQDDNRDANEGGVLTTSGVLAGQSLPFRHPLALNGVGRFWTANPKQLNLYAALGATDPNRWLQYLGAGVGYDGNAGGAGNISWLNPFGGALMVNPIVGANFASPVASPAVLIDDPNELTLDPNHLQRPYDEPLDAKDSLLLFLGASDRSRTGITSRVQDLMPANITPTSSSNFYQLEVARRFTTESWDVKQFALPRFIGGVGVDGQPGVAGVDDNQDGQVDDENERGWPGSDDDRAWEYNVDFDNNGLLEFPPQFLGGSGTEQAFQPNDPFRPQLRRLLTVEFGNTNTPRNPMRLNINEFLDVEHRTGTQSNPYTDPLAYRPLTPHSTDNALTTVPPASPLPNYPPTTEGEKEFWARRDRQQMARDIYVLLYTFCGGNDSINLATTSGDTAYHGKIRRQMAQFAVNMVDSLDRDNVITAFEYDDNLADGWNLDDDFTTDDSASLPASSDRFVVFGTEAQELTFSETLWLWQGQATGMTPDHARTPFDETTGEHNFFQIELRSSSAFDVDLATTVSTTANTGIWRIVRDDIGNGTANDNVLVFQNGAGTVSPGSLFTIANSDALPIGSASLYVDHTGAAADFELVAPNVAGAAYTGTTLPPVANLDLIHTTHSTWFVLATGGVGDFLSRTNNPTTTGATTTDEVNLRLERRLNPYLPQVTSNGWVTVDSFNRVLRRDLKIDPAVVTQADAANRLAATGAFVNPNISSRERRQPLDGGNVADNNGTGGGPSPHRNSIGRNNATGATSFSLFQPHFDRDFASVVELFDVPLEGPNLLTRIIPDSRRPPNRVDNSDNGIGQLENRGPYTFGAAVLMQSEDRDSDENLLSATDDTNNNGFQDAGETDTNGNGFFDFGEDFNKNGVLDAHPYHFHRLLSLVEVPSRMHRQLGDPLKLNRVPGKINLNGVRDPRVLAGLIDDRQVIGPPERTGNDIDTDSTIEPGLQDLLGDTVEDASGTSIQRDWWFQFLVARDGLDPTTSLPIPISGFSRPFHDVGYLRYDQEFGQQSSIEDTILRELPGAVKYTGSMGKGKGKGKAIGRTGGGKGAEGPSDGRRLFELATDAEFEGQSLEPLMRYRLLSKMIGNTTTRSNVFVVHATIGMFACREYPNGAVRIGGQMDVDGDGTPDTHRAIFIIDRSDIQNAYDPGSRSFDWKKLVKARQRIN